MYLLVLFALCLVIGHLWMEVRALRERMDALDIVPAWTPEPITSPEPERLPVAEIMAPAAPDPVTLGSASPAAPALAEPWAMAHEEDTIVADARPAFNFEDIFGRRLPIWAGGVTLAVAGFLIVKYSIQAGLLSPMTRVILGMLFGTALIGTAEVALRMDKAVRDVRVRQALSGAGVATLFAAILVAANLYHLIVPMTAFVGLAAVTALAAILSLRFGAPSAVLGLIGGLAAPALVGSAQPNVPLLALYLALTVGGLSTVARSQRWWWLGAAALFGGFGWGLLLIVNGLADLSQTLSVGFLTIALAAIVPLLLVGERAVIVRLVASIAGCAQMAAMVALGGYALLDWGLLGLLSIAALWLSRRERMLADVPALALGVAILLCITWPATSKMDLALVLAGIGLIHALPAALRVWTARTRPIDAPMIAAAALTIALMPAYDFASLAPILRSAPALLGAVIAAGVAAWGWIDLARCTDSRFAVLTGATAAALGFAALFGLADWTLPPVAALLALGLLELGREADNRHIEHIAWAFGATCVALLLLLQQAIVWGGNPGAADWIACARWAVPAAVAIGFAVRASVRVGRVAQVLAVLLAYSALAEIVPGAWLAVVPALMLAGLAAPGRAALLPAAATAAALSLGWAISPLADWLVQSAVTVVTGEPLALYAANLATGLRQIAAPGLALALTAARLPMPRPARTGCHAVAAGFCLIAVHIAYKHLFLIDGLAAFVAHGMAERTVWEMALAAGAVGAWALRTPRIALMLGGSALAHFAWFTVVIDNPLWRMQQVGPWLVPAYATAFALVWAADWLLPNAQRLRSWAMMGLIALFAFSALRQIAHGAMPLQLGVDGREDIARSVLAIAVAVGFLRYGIAKAARDWRIASLGLMLVAVGKVFLFDASGLDGLLRIASFAALGLSLIGVGWLYSRYLPDESVRP